MPNSTSSDTCSIASTSSSSSSPSSSSPSPTPFAYAKCGIEYEDDAATPTEEAGQPPAPPCYDAVLLENQLALSTKHPGLLPDDLARAVEAFLNDADGAPADHPYRTYHTLSARQFADGSGSYVGQVDHKTRRHGLGHMRYENDDRYHGAWHKGRRDGSGAFFWAETGSVYAGQWRAGERHGPGHFVSGPRRRGPDRGVVYSGTWQKGRMVGRGAVAFVNERGQLEQWPEVAWNGEEPEGRGGRRKSLLSLLPF